MSQGSVEERLSEVEKQLATLLTAAHRDKGRGDWIERVAGSTHGDPEFAEILRLGREIRDAEAPVQEPE